MKKADNHADYRLFSFIHKRFLFSNIFRKASAPIMKRIKCKKADSLAVSEAFERFVQERKTRGLTDKTLDSYRNIFHSISLRMDLEKPISELCKDDYQKLVIKLRDENLSATTIYSYTKALKTFLLWCKKTPFGNVSERCFFKIERGGMTLLY